MRHDRAANFDIYLKGHAGDTISVDRIGRKSNYIAKPRLTMLLTIQPSVLHGLMDNATFRGRGLCGRFLYAMCKSKVGRREVSPKSREYPKRNGIVNAEYTVKQTRAQADLTEAKAALDKVRRDMDGYNDTVAAIRRELAAAVDAAFVADPARVDAAAVELMKSGICTAADFEKLMHDAGQTDNPTMIRLIASYAAKAADSLKENDGRISYDRREEFSRLNAVGQQGAGYTSRAKLQEFDALADTFRRTMRNPGMIGSWDMLTGNAIEAF